MIISRIRELPGLLGQTVTLQGWAWRVRGSGKVLFIQMRDGSGFAQVVLEMANLPADVFEAVRHLGQESTLKVTGTVGKNTRDALGVEVLASAVQIIAQTRDYPIGPKEHGTDFLMDLRHLWLRSPRQQAIAVVRHRIIKSIRDFLDQQDFTLVDAPIFTPNECEGSSTLFATDYFGQNAYLSQSGQLYMEAACQALGKVYCLGPTFRAENSNTRRHLTEFWMVEPEVAFMDLEGDIILAENLIRFVVRSVLENCRQELLLLERDLASLERVAQEPFVRISYDQAVEILRESGQKFTWGDDFGGADETVISSKFGVPVVVHRYPRSIKPFYMKGDSNDARLALNMDILAPEGYGEIVGGGQREENLAVLEAGLQRAGLDLTTYSWYLDLRRYGAVPHSGFGLGIERTVAWLCGLPHIRETIPFPRLPNRLKP